MRFDHILQAHVSAIFFYSQICSRKSYFDFAIVDKDCYLTFTKKEFTF